MINDDCILYDIETWTHGGRPDPETDDFRCIGCYSYKYKKYYFLMDPKKIASLLDDHKVIVGFNNKNYDNPILLRHEMLPEYKFIVDLWECCKKRKTILKIENESLSLSNLAKVFNLEEKKIDDFDYKSLEELPKYWSKEKKKNIMKYTIQDIKTTKKLFEHMCDYFDSFKDLMNNKDKLSYKWITTSPGAYAYKVLCNLADIEETYTDSDDGEKKPYPGGFVTLPTQSEAHGKIYCLDFNSAYPHAFMMANLFSPGNDFKGNKLFPLKGSYSTKELGKLEKVIKSMYATRQQLKAAGDKREYVYKIIINTIYGITGSPVFASVYDYNRAYDCTLICREMIKLAREVFKSTGYNVIYTDTDSVYLEDPFDNKDILLSVKDIIISRIKSQLPFPQETFDMGIDAHIKHIYFFKNKAGTFLKKHYIYVTEDDKVVIKGIPAIKNDSSVLGLDFINEVLVPALKIGKVSLTRPIASEWLENKITENISCVQRRFRVQAKYKTDSSIQAQISNKYGAGTHLLIPNDSYGVGKSIHYCTFEEFKDQGLTANNLVLKKFWEELRGFIER